MPINIDLTCDTCGEPVEEILCPDCGRPFECGLGECIFAHPPQGLCSATGPTLEYAGEFRGEGPLFVCVAYVKELKHEEECQHLAKLRMRRLEGHYWMCTQCGATLPGEHTGFMDSRPPTPENEGR